MRKQPFYLISILAALTITLTLGPRAPSAATADSNLLTGYYNMMGYEGVGTIGENLANFGPAPPVGDYVTTHCRYIDVTPVFLRQYYLRYFLHLPNGATLTRIDAYIADFADIGSMTVALRERPWNSRDEGTSLGSANTAPGVSGDTTLTIPNLAVVIDNQTTQYWLDVFFNQQEIPGQLCVYGIQATYHYEGGYLPLIRKGG